MKNVQVYSQARFYQLKEQTINIHMSPKKGHSGRKGRRKHYFIPRYYILYIIISSLINDICTFSINTFCFLSWLRKSLLESCCLLIAAAAEQCKDLQLLDQQLYGTKSKSPTIVEVDLMVLTWRERWWVGVLVYLEVWVLVVRCVWAGPSLWSYDAVVLSYPHDRRRACAVTLHYVRSIKY